ncbi:Site-specific recombinase XerD [Haloechinothrix alba]|uniref:Site-specific recombinase XerD n=1 Tax=Haloechinothrix alba TaxID=664784 RepID=A0A238ZVF3_9PSEU|nr:tyrosine-type recombinase/integrase [Haloechinothrix alba]SNR87325.1 Site-specific recombinase XerD [Haloechinothrix alba]
MAKRRSRGEGGLYWSERRQRYIAEVSLGFDGRGKRIVKKASGKTKTAARDKLKEIMRDLDDGVPMEAEHYTVGDAVESWLSYGLNGRDESTIQNYRNLAEIHLIPKLGAAKLRRLSAEAVDKWLADVAATVSTRTVRLLHSILNRSVKHAQARDKVKRNVVALCDVPTGLEGRPSKSLTFEQTEAVLKASESSPLHAYIVLSLLIGARTEELRALTWDHVDLYGDKDAADPVSPSVSVWHSVREGGDTKSRKSRRTLAMPHRCVVALRLHRLRQREIKRQAGGRWREHGLVFASQVGTPLDSHNVRREFRKVVKAAGLTPEDWTPREMRHSFVSLLSNSGVSLEDIARLVGHSGTTVTESVYRHEIRPVMVEGATAMDQLFPRNKRKR